MGSSKFNKRYTTVFGAIIVLVLIATFYLLSVTMQSVKTERLNIEFLQDISDYRSAGMLETLGVEIARMRDLGFDYSKYLDDMSDAELEDELFRDTITHKVGANTAFIFALAIIAMQVVVVELIAIIWYLTEARHDRRIKRLQLEDGGGEK
jgi:hypothetical protein